MCLAASLAVESRALTIWTVGTGASVQNADRSAAFDRLGPASVDLASYIEGGLSISVPDYSYAAFDAFGLGRPSGGFFYGRGGNTDYVSIKTADAREIEAIEFEYGNGFFSDHYIWTCWETWKDGVQVGSGTFDVPRGTIVGWNDVGGFDELRVASGPYLRRTGGFQGIALDNLRIQLADIPPVPVPDAGATLWLLGIASVLLIRGGIARRKP